MADLILEPTPNGGQISFTSKSDFATSDALYISAYVSLFSKPYWGNQISLPSHRLVSRLNDLFQDNITASTRNLAERYTREGLDYLLSEGIASEIDVDVSIQNANTLIIEIQITQPDGNVLEFAYGMNWKAQAVELEFVGGIA